MSTAPLDDPYAMLRQAHPLLANVTKETLAQYMTYATTWNRFGELQRDDSIVADPLLEPLARELGQVLVGIFPAMGNGADVVNYGILRHYCFDKKISERDPAIRQIVTVGCGTDTRAFRLEGIEKCSFFEMHLIPELLAYKERRLVEMGAQLKAKDRAAFCTSFHDDGWRKDLLAHGFDPQLPTFWIVESTLQFLAPDEGVDLLNGIDCLSASHSQLLTERLLGGGVDLDMDENANVELLVHTKLRYGEDGGVFRDLNWNVELLIRRNQAFEYYGAMWDPERLDRFRVTDDEAVAGPWFTALFSKP